MAFVDDVIKRVRDWDAARPRSSQAEVGWSEVGGCRAYMGFRLDGAWASDETDNWAATRGTAIHLLLEQILEPASGMLTEVTTSYRDIPGHADLVIDPTSVTDWKGLALTTPLPTPAGWTTMGAVQPGDRVFGSDGRPCRVTRKSGIKRIGTYIVRFKDGAAITCDREHLWWVMRGQTVRGRMEVVGVEEMADSVTRWGQVNWRVPTTEPLELPAAELPVNPYVLGCWLGDGSCGNGHVTGTQAIFSEIEREGFRIGPTSPSERARTAPHRTVYGLMTMLRNAGVLFDKHVPDIFLRASVAQRQALVQGLMDTDGTWNKTRKRAVFETTSKALAEAMRELLASLGEKPTLHWVRRNGFGLTVEAAMVEWTVSRFNPFRLPAKASLVVITNQKIARARWRTISGIEPGPDVETACIAVDSPNSTYLCGAEMIPTHNTKTLASSHLWQEDPKAFRQARIQVHGYAAGLVDEGRLPPGCTVRIVVIPVDGTFADWWAWEEPFDRALADEGADRLEDVRERMAAGEALPKDKHYMFCRDYCGFFSLCRGQDDPNAAGEITDPEMAAAIASYGTATEEMGRLKRARGKIVPLIRGVRGTAGEWRITLGDDGDEGEQPDMEAIAAIFSARGEDVPMTSKAGRSGQMRVTRIKKPKGKVA